MDICRDARNRRSPKNYEGIRGRAYAGKQSQEGGRRSEVQLERRHSQESGRKGLRESSRRKAVAGRRSQEGRRRQRRIVAVIGPDRVLACEGFPAHAFLRTPSCAGRP
jgi:hypothetical protein